MQKNPKFKYLKSVRVRFLRRMFWREISEAKYLNSVRQFYFNSSDEDILAIVHHSRNLVHNNGRHQFRVEIRKE